ncbi:hypothetical protein ABIA25_001557 [Sinorhizobium fredii]|uniref:hypothetical protein n=1 Tax=Rhizobium fredii TaxID=380 RepID=UPI0035113726
MDEEPTKGFFDELKELGFRALRRARLTVGQGHPREQLRRHRPGQEHSRRELRDDEKKEK